MATTDVPLGAAIETSCFLFAVRIEGPYGPASGPLYSETKSGGVAPSVKLPAVRRCSSLHPATPPLLLQRDLVRQLDDRLRTAATVTARFTDLSDVAGDRTSQVRDTVEQHLNGDVYGL